MMRPPVSHTQKELTIKKLTLYYNHQDAANGIWGGIALTLIFLVVGLVRTGGYRAFEMPFEAVIGIIITVVSFVRAKDTRPVITLDETALHDYRHGGNFIAWDTIYTIRLYQKKQRNAASTPVLCIDDHIHIPLNGLSPSSLTVRRYLQDLQAAGHLTATLQENI